VSYAVSISGFGASFVKTLSILMMTAFWDIAPCSLVEVDRVSEVRTASVIFRSEDGGCTRH
jgi:hypothetical protein